MTTIGVLGGGQLGRMLAQAGRDRGDRFVFLDPAADACAGEYGELITAPWDDSSALARLAQAADVVTYDFENVPDATARALASQRPFHPGPDALAAFQDRLEEKTLLRRLGVPTPAFQPLDTRPELLQALDAIGYPAVLKTRRFGYDGKGQAVLRGPEDLERAWQRLGGRPLILEAFVPFERECSIIAVRAADGDCHFWPLTLNLHRDGVLAASLAPFASPLQDEAEAHARRLLDYFDYTGVLALELFEVGGRLLANEVAPRVHNSGHWTIDGAETSQFANHLAAISGHPLGPTGARHPALMFNWIGALPDPVDVPGVHWHDYCKVPRRGRKLGHATVVGEDTEALRRRATAVAAAVGGETPRVLRTLLEQA